MVVNKCNNCQNDNICKYSKEYKDIYEKIKSLMQNNNVILKEESVFKVELGCNYYKEMTSYYNNYNYVGLKGECPQPLESYYPYPFKECVECINKEWWDRYNSGDPIAGYIPCSSCLYYKNADPVRVNITCTNSTDTCITNLNDLRGSTPSFNSNTISNNTNTNKNEDKEM